MSIDERSFVNRGYNNRAVAFAPTLVLPVTRPSPSCWFVTLGGLLPRLLLTFIQRPF